MLHAKTALLGVGNILQADDGIGVYATRFLEQNYTFDPEIALINVGVEGMNLLNVFVQYERIIILDVIQIDDEAGSIYHIPSSELTSYGLNNSAGAHEVGILECLDMLKLLDRPLPESSVLGIVPHTITMHMGLSPVLEKHFLTFIQTLLDILKKEGITIVGKAQRVTLEDVVNAFPSR